jgi:hypothetical protein
VSDRQGGAVQVAEAARASRSRLHVALTAEQVSRLVRALDPEDEILDLFEA